MVRGTDIRLELVRIGRIYRQVGGRRGARGRGQEGGGQGDARGVLDGEPSEVYVPSRKEIGIQF